MKVVETKQLEKVAIAQMESLKTSIAKAQLTDREISTLPEGTRMYESVGRMSVRSYVVLSWKVQVYVFSCTLIPFLPGSC